MKLDDIYAPVRADLELVEVKLAEIARNDIPLLSQMLEYALLNGGKRVRPALTLLCGKFNKYDSKLLMPMAVAVELLHIATLVHDDIIDNSAVRHGKPAVYRKWGSNSALLLGDYLFSRAGSLATTTENIRVIRRFTETLMIISGGELREASVNFVPGQARENYYKWISDKIAEEIDEEVEHLVKNAYAKALEIMTENKERLKYIAEQLISKETLDESSFEALLKDPLPAPDFQGTPAS